MTNTSAKKLVFVVNSDWFFISHRLPLALAAIKSGYKVYVVTHNFGQKELIESYGIEFIHQNFNLKKLYPILFIRLFFIYQKIKPDIIHHVGIKPAIFGSLSALLILKNPPKLVNAITGLGYVFTGNERLRLQFLTKLLMKFVFNQKYTHFIFQNNNDKQFFEQLGLLKKHPYTLIKGAGVNHNNYQYKAPVEKSKLTVVLASRMLYDKGVKEFIEAAQVLKHKWKGNAEFILMGDIDTNNPSSVTTDYLIQHQIEGYLTWVGHQKNVIEQFEKADVVCLPSYREGLPKVLVEAMCVGRPIVTTYAPGCKDCIDDGRNGILVPVMETISLADAIDELLANSNKRLEMGKASRVFMENQFTLDQVIKQTIQVYDSL